MLCLNIPYFPEALLALNGYGRLIMLVLIKCILLKTFSNYFIYTWFINDRCLLRILPLLVFGEKWYMWHSDIPVMLFWHRMMTAVGVARLDGFTVGGLDGKLLLDCA